MAEIDLFALRQNADAIAAEVGPSVGVLAVVKADAYGHGAVACARALERKVWGFAVSLVEEGIELRRVGNVEAPIIVLGSSYGYSHRDVVAYGLTPVVSDPRDLGRFARAAAELDRVRPVGVHVKIDTGMSRLGVRPEGLPELIEALAATPGVELAGVCTHLADADGDDPEPTRAQLAVFEAGRKQLLDAGLRPTLTHIANSAGAARFPGARADLVRPGLRLYEGVMTLRSRVVALRDLPAGARVSYGGAFQATRPTRIATVPIGYADGYSRRYSGRAQVLVGGRRCPVVGAITMDMCMVDVTGVACAVGDDVVLLGAQGSERITADEVARFGDTIVWEVFTSISKRVPRVYRGERAA